MTYPYAIVSDVHCHSWSQFSQVNADGVNTRLATILGELWRAAVDIKARGGKVLRVAGDLFHVRGKIEPSVFNPTMDMFRKIAVELGVDVQILPGNHDLEGKHSNKLGNAMQQLDLIDGIEVTIEPYIDDDIVMLPWIEDLNELRAECAKHVDALKDLIIHAPLNGVIKGLPDNGLDPAELAALGYKRVFVGHYHNHKVFGGGVFSVGATSHQTWSDPGTAAGYLIVNEKTVEHVPTNAPLFVNIDDPDDIDPTTVAGNYVRLRLSDVAETTMRDIKEKLRSDGALDWVDHSSKKREITRGNGVAQPANLTLEVSVANYVDVHLETKLDKARVAKEALDILTEARTVGDDS